MRELFRHRTPVLRTAPGGHFASLRSRSVNRLAVRSYRILFFNVLNFSSRQSGRTMRELFRHRTPVLRTAPRGHFASLRSRSVNRLVVLLLSYDVFQCSKLSFSSERLYLRELFRHRTPVLRTAPGGHFASLRSRSVNRLAVRSYRILFFNVLNFSSRQSGRTMRELFRHRTPVLRTAPRGHFASLRSRSVNRLVVLLLSYDVFQCSKLSFSSERLYLRELFRHRTPVLRTAPGGHFASLRSRSVNRLPYLEQGQRGDC